MPTMRRRSQGSSSPYRALAHHQQAAAQANLTDSVSLIRSFDDERLSSRPLRPSPLSASTIKDMPLDIADRMRSFPLFMSAPEEFLTAIGTRVKPQIHYPNDQIVREGDEAKAMYWLVRGVVAVTSRDGEAVYAELKPGAFFGEIGVLMDVPRTATIVCRAKCLLLVLKKEDLQAVIPDYPEMEKAIRDEALERLSLTKKLRKESSTTLHSHKGDLNARAVAPGKVELGERGIFRDGTVVNSKKRKSPSPGIIEDPAAGSAIASGFVNIRKTLRELPLFSTLSPDILHFLGLSAQPGTYPPFTDIVRQGSPGNEIYFIVQGEAEVVHASSKEGGESSASTAIERRPRLKAGQYFGEVSSLGFSRGRTATVRSITTVECLMIPGDALEELWRRCPPDIKSQVERVARMRLEQQDDDVDMMDADAKANNTARTDSPTPSTPSTPGRRTALPHVTFTTPSKPSSPSKDESDTMERKDPDPFLSVDMENLRNRRRLSLAPPTPQTESSLIKTNGNRSQSKDGPRPTARLAVSVTDAEAGTPSKRAKTLPQRPHSASKPVFSDEILVHVFKDLDIAELMRLRAVCSSWRTLLTTSPVLCNHVDFTDYNRKVNDDVLVRVLAPFIGERAVTMDLNNCFHITDDGFAALWRSCGKNVKRWRMRSVWDVSANQILEMSENAKGLEEIDWSNCRKVGDNLLGRVVGWVVPQPSPVSKQVVISSTASRMRSQQQQQQQQQQQHQKPQNGPPPGTVIGCSKLNTLNLSYCKHITDRSMAHLAAHASNRLRSLSLTRCTSITDAGFQSWAPFRFEQLSFLCLADCTYLSDNAIVALANAAKNLITLDLSFCCALSDTATEVVALGLPRLRELRMAFCGSAVSDASLESIALHLNELEGISVRGCVRVTGKGVESLLKSCGRLKWIDVSQCRNLEPWLRAGGVGYWGYDERAGVAQSDEDWHSDDDDLGDDHDERIKQATKTTSMLSVHSYPTKPRVGGGISTLSTRRPVRFIIEKGFLGLR